MGFLYGTRPDVDIGDVIMLSLPGKRAGFGPGLEDQFIGLPEPFHGVRRRHRIIEVLAADAAHKTGYDPPAGDHIQHGDLFCDPHRVTV